MRRIDRAHQNLLRAADAARDQVLAEARTEMKPGRTDLWARFAAINPLDLMSADAAADVRAASAGLITWPPAATRS